MSTDAPTTFFCEFRLLDEHTTRDTCMTLFGGMTPDDDKRELGNVNLLGRWSCVGEARGFCIAQAPDVNTMQRWLNAWVTMADIRVTPVLDDNQHRELVTGTTPTFTVSYDQVNAEAKEGESLYFVKYQFREGMRDQGFQAFAAMSEADDQKDSGRCTSYGRWHVPSQGCGYAIASCPSAHDIYKWAYNWNSLCDCEISPVTSDSVTREIIRSGLGFSVKHANLVEQLEQLNVDTGPCYVDAKFTFSNAENKQKFIDILNGENGLQVTRAWSGCQSIECYTSQENELVFTIRQKWDKASDHESYLNMRKSTGLFDSVMEMLSSPLEITHHRVLEC